MTEEHSSDLWNIDEGDEITLTTTTGFEVSGECTSRSKIHSEGPNLTEQNQWQIAGDEGTDYVIITVDGLSGIEGTNPFPIQHPLTEDNRNDKEFGYITEVQHD